MFRFLFLYFLLLCSLAHSQKPTLLVEQKTASSGNHYTVFHKGSNKVEFTTTRPDSKDTSLLLCIAAAFTRLDDGKVDGAYAINGQVMQEVPNLRLGGGIFMNAKTCEIFPYHAYPPSSGIIKDPTLSKEMKKKIKDGKYSFFQQIQLIVNGQAERFVDEKHFQRRAIVVFKNKSVAIIESKTAITLAAFSKDLVGLGVDNALYTDMGDWDEGWYRDANGKVKVTGTSKSQTGRQSNWVVFRQAGK
jgi:hypothetical protein